jgi:hypothetical protein
MARATTTTMADGDAMETAAVMGDGNCNSNGRATATAMGNGDSSGDGDKDGDGHGNGDGNSNCNGNGNSKGNNDEGRIASSCAGNVQRCGRGDTLPPPPWTQRSVHLPALHHGGDTAKSVCSLSR